MMKNRVIWLATAALSLFVLTSSYGVKNQRLSQKISKVAKLGKIDESGDIKKFSAYADSVGEYIAKDLTKKTPYNPEKRELYKVIVKFVATVGCNKFDTDEHYKVVEKLLDVAVAHAPEFNNKRINSGIKKQQDKFLKEKNNPKMREHKKKRKVRVSGLRSARKSKSISKKKSASKKRSVKKSQSASKIKKINRVRKSKVKKENQVKRSAGIAV